MGNNDTLKNLLVAGAVFILIMTLLQRFSPPVKPPGSGQTGPDTTIPQKVQTALESDSTPGEKAPSKFQVVQADRELTLKMGAPPTGTSQVRPDQLPYRMGLVLSNVGASVESAALTDHSADLKSDARYTLLSPIKHDDATTYRSLAIEKVRIDGEDVRLDDTKWQASEVQPYVTKGQEGQRVSFSVKVNEGDEPVLRITRTFTLPRQRLKDGRHDLWSTIGVENISGKPHRVLLSYRGAVGVPEGSGRNSRRMIDIGVTDENGLVNGHRSYESKIERQPGERLSLYEYDGQLPEVRAAWAAIGNTYFTCTVAPVDAGFRSVSGDISEIAAYDMDGRSETTDDVTESFVTTPANLKPGEKKSYHSAIYLGEKDAKAFRAQPDYAARNYYYQITQSFGACTFTALVELMIWLLNHLYFVVRDFGLAIILLVVFMRVLLHPITKKGQVNMVRMQKQMGAFSPKMNEVKKKYPNDKAKQQQEMMKLYREHGINPAGQLFTCVPMAIQMPIWIALYLSLSNNILMRHQPAFFGLLWIDDLTAQDALYTFASPLTIPLVGWKIAAFNLLPLLVAIFMFLQQKTQPKPPPNPNATPEQKSQQEMMQKLMPMMSIMMLLIFYKMPAGLNLYIMCSSMFGWLEQKRIRAHIKEQEANGSFDKPAHPKDGGGRGLLAKLSGAKQDGSPGWLEKIQKAAEQAQKDQHTQRSGKKRN